jgi:hypothetical protein
MGSRGGFEYPIYSVSHEWQLAESGQELVADGRPL